MHGPTIKRQLLLQYNLNFAHVCICYEININLCDMFDITNIICCDTPTYYKFAFVLELLTASLKLASYFCTNTGYMFKNRIPLSTL